MLRAVLGDGAFGRKNLIAQLRHPRAEQIGGALGFCNLAGKLAVEILSHHRIGDRCGQSRVRRPVVNRNRVGDAFTLDLQGARENADRAIASGFRTDPARCAGQEGWIEDRVLEQLLRVNDLPQQIRGLKHLHRGIDRR
ncbi:MAG: hypothetical protein ACTHM0_13620 [Sphingomonas sp.]